MSELTEKGSVMLGAVANYAARDDVTITAGSAQGNFPASNLSDPASTTVWLSEATDVARSTIQVDLGDDPSFSPFVTSVGIGGTNAAPEAQVLFRASAGVLADPVSLPSALDGASTGTTGNVTDIDSGMDSPTAAGLTIATSGRAIVDMADSGSAILDGENNACLALRMRIDDGAGGPLAIRKRTIDVQLREGGADVLELATTVHLDATDRIYYFPFTTSTDTASGAGGATPSGLGFAVGWAAAEDLIISEAEIRFEDDSALWRSGWQAIGTVASGRVASAIEAHYRYPSGNPPKVGAGPASAAFLGSADAGDSAITAARFWTVSIRDGRNKDGYVSVQSVLLGPAYGDVADSGKLTVEGSVTFGVVMTESRQVTLGGNEIVEAVRAVETIEFPFVDQTTTASQVLFEHILKGDQPIILGFSPVAINGLVPETFIGRLSSDRRFQITRGDTERARGTMRFQEI